MLCSPATSSREWWRTIKQLTGGLGSTNILILNDERAQCISAKDKAETFAAVFSLKCQADNPSRPPPVVPSITDTSLLAIRFTPHDMKKCLETLDTAKSMGPDNILAVVLKTCAPDLAVLLVKLFQYSYNTGIYLKMWKSAQVFPVHKKQDKSNLANYSPISLHSIVSKVMEGVINSAIKQHLLSNNQFGFRQDHSAPDLITALVQAWTKELNSRCE
eukprot:g45067.t1